MKIGVVTMVKDMGLFLPAVLQSLSWVDGIYVYDDNSSDDTQSILRHFDKVPIRLEISKDPAPAFSRGEMRVRNYVIERAFEELRVDILILVDGDELVSSKLKDVICDKMADGEFDSICFSTWHLYDPAHYLHFLETKINGVDLIDPHTRVITRGKRFEPLVEFKDGSHPIINPTSKTY